MKQFNQREFVKLLNKNGFRLNRCKGGHKIFVNLQGNHISIPQRIPCVIAHRLIKENSLI